MKYVYIALKWIFGAFFLILGLVLMVKTPLGGGALILLSLLLLPPVRNFLYIKTNKKIPIKILVASIFVLIVIILGVLVSQRQDEMALAEHTREVAFREEIIAMRSTIKSAKQGDAPAQFNLGIMYDKGKGVAQDDKQAAIWYRKAAEQGHALAQYNLGIVYANGEGVPQDDKQAVMWYRRAAEQGLAQAQYNLGIVYANGEGVPQDDKQAVMWYRRAAEQGLAQAQFNLGVSYANGKGLLQDDKQSAIWYGRAAEQGYAPAQDKIGIMSVNDNGGLQNDKQDITADLVDIKSAKLGDREVPISTLKKVVSLTYDISLNWDHGVMKKYIEASNFIKNEKIYQTLFTKNSHLGKLKKCKNFKNSEFEQSDIFVIKQDCEFESGNAFIQLIFKPKDSNNELMGITIKEVLSEERINCGILAYKDKNYYVKDKTLDIPFVSEKESPEFSFGCIIEKSGGFQVHYIIESSKKMVGNSFDSDIHLPTSERKIIETEKSNVVDGAYFSITLDNSDLPGPYEVSVFIDDILSKQVTFNVH
ncbi:MAG: TPR repeat protein [Oleiphilaceae bacterium]|jgi:TPR repeat protein